LRQGGERFDGRQAALLGLLAAATRALLIATGQFLFPNGLQLHVVLQKFQSRVLRVSVSPV
jgi:hypothetical protein